MVRYPLTDPDFICSRFKFRELREGGDVSPGALPCPRTRPGSLALPSIDIAFDGTLLGFDTEVWEGWPCLSSQFSAHDGQGSGVSRISLVNQQSCVAPAQLKRGTSARLRHFPRLPCPGNDIPHLFPTQRHHRIASFTRCDDNPEFIPTCRDVIIPLVAKGDYMSEDYVANAVGLGNCCGGVGVNADVFFAENGLELEIFRGEVGVVNYIIAGGS